MLWNILKLLLCGFVVAQVATLVTTLYLHRGSTHKSLEFNPVIEFFFQLTLWITTGINRKEWVAVHLCHHAHTDEEGDPHSPLLLGLKEVQLGNVFLYRKAAKDPKVLWYGRNIQLSWVERNLFFSPYLGLLIGVSLACWGFGWWQGILVSLLHTIFYLQLNSLVNAYCHVKGYKNFPEFPAFNSIWAGLSTCGEGFHNNHHHKPGNPKLSDKWFEFDIGWLVVQFLQLFGLARVC